MDKKQNGINNLHNLAQFALFVSSYLPLFILIVIRQIFNNNDFLEWGGFNLLAFNIFIKKFGLSFLLLVISAIGYIGYRITFRNIDKVAENGELIWINDVKNKNSEAIGYIATYILPFLFNSFDTWYEVVSVLFLLFIIYRIYINSSMLLINPLLSISYSIYEIEYEKNKKMCSGLMITRQKFLKDEIEAKIYELGHKLYYLKTE